MPSQNRLRRALLTAAVAGALVAGGLTPAAALGGASASVAPSSIVAAASTTKTAVTTAPTSQSVVSGQKVTFTVKAKGTRLSYQWYVKKPGNSWYSKISGATSTSYSLRPSSARDGARYRVIVKGAGGTVTSTSAVLTVITKPRFSYIKTDGYRVASGDRVQFEMTASGKNLTYEWAVMRPTQREYAVVSHKSEYALIAKARLDGSQVRVTVRNAAGKSSFWWALGVTSTASDPYPVGQWGGVAGWGMRVKAAEPNPDVSAPEGSRVVTGYVFGFSPGCESPNLLSIGLRGNDGVLYAAQFPPQEEYPNCECFSGEGCFGDAADGWSFTFDAVIPESALPGAVWEFTGPPTEWSSGGTAWFTVATTATG